MDWNWPLLIINLIAGAFVGYVTKTLAINMLFRRYPIIGGAKIIEDREQLEVAMSELVEERLIRPDTLTSEFQKPAFKETFEMLVESIVQDTIQENIRHLDTLEGVKGLGGTIEKSREFLIEQSEQILGPSQQMLLRHILVQDVLSPDQLQHVVRQLLLMSSAALYSHRQNLTETWHQEAQIMSWGELLPEPLVDALIDNLLPIDLGARLGQEWGELLTQLGDEAVEMLIDDTLLDQLEASLKSRTMAELLGDWAHHDALASLFERLRQLFNSESGQELLNELLEQVLNILRELDMPLSSLLTPAIEQSLLSFLQRHLPDLILQLEAWIAINRDEMQDLINSAIETHLASENLVKMLVGNIFVQQLAERYQIIESTLRELKEMANQSGPNVIALLNRFLNHTHISDLVGLAERYLLDRKALIAVLLELINIYFPRLHLAAADQLLQMRLEEIPGIAELNLKTLFHRHLYPSFKRAALEHWLESPEAVLQLRTGIKDWLRTLRDQPLSSGTTGRMGEGLQGLALSWLNRPAVQEALIQRIAVEIRQVFSGQSLEKLLDSNLQTDLRSRLTSLYKRKLDEFLELVRQEKIINLYHLSTQIYRQLCENRAFPRQLADTLVNLMVRLISEHRLLDGKIFVAVKESFGRFSNDELKDEMESFMGKELEPIKLLGAFLGAGVGVGMWWLSLVPGYHTFVTGYWALFTYSLSYALSEVGTNWMAIKMLFRPYHPRKFLGITLPFTPGIFPKNKSALAESMVNFIDKKLLAKDNMVQILEKYHPKWKSVIKQVVSENDYAVVDETIRTYTRENFDHLAPDLIRVAFHEVRRNREEIARYLVQELKQFKLETSDQERLQSELENRILLSREQVTDALIQTFYRYRQDDARLMDRLPAETRHLFEQGLSAAVEVIYSRVLELLPGGKLPEAVADRLPPLLQQLMTQQLTRLLPKSVLGPIQAQLITWLGTQLQNPHWHQALFNLLETRVLNRGLSSERSLGELWDGRLISVAVSESDIIIKALSDYLLRVSANQKETIVRMVLSEVEKKGPVESMMVLFGGVGRDVRGVVDVMVDRSLPTYLASKQQELKVVFQHYVQNHLAKIQLADLGLHEQVFDLANIRVILQQRVLNNPSLAQILQRLSSQVLESIFAHLALQDMLSMLDLASLEEILRRFGPEADLMRQHLAERLSHRRKDVLRMLGELQSMALRLLLTDRSARELLTQISGPQLELTLNQLLEKVYSSASFAKLRSLLLSDLLHELQRDLTGFLDENILQRDLTALIEVLASRPERLNPVLSGQADYADSLRQNTRNRHFQQDLQQMLKPITFSFIELMNDNIEQETKQALEDILVNSLVDSLRINNREILEPISFDEIVRAEVHKMDPARIEAMFDFAKPIFRLLIWYGALGGLIGLAVAMIEVML